MQSQFDYISDLSMGYWKSQVLIVAVEFKIFTLLHKTTLSASDISKQIKADKRATEMLLNALVGLRLLSKKGRLFKNNAISNIFLVEKLPYYQGDRIRLTKNLWDNWTKLGKAIKSGKPVSFINACKKVDPKRRKVFISAMRDFSVLKSKLVAEKLDLSGRELLLDLGGGPGSYAIEFVKSNPKLNAVVYDLNGVTKITKKYISDAKLTKRIKTMEGECVNGSYGKELYDVIFISNLLHMYDENINLGIIRKCKQALKSKGMIVIHDFLLDASMTESPFGAIFSLNMLVGTHGGRNYSDNEIKGWLNKSGFVKARKTMVDADTGMIIAFK
ncbi:MAG: methyltransferase [Candidatus Anammoxibacter sp.]